MCPGHTSCKREAPPPAPAAPRTLPVTPPTRRCGVATVASVYCVVWGQAAFADEVSVLTEAVPGSGQCPGSGQLLWPETDTEEEGQIRRWCSQRLAEWSACITLPGTVTETQDGGLRHVLHRSENSGGGSTRPPHVGRAWFCYFLSLQTQRKQSGKSCLGTSTRSVDLRRVLYAWHGGGARCARSLQREHSVMVLRGSPPAAK